MAQTPTRIGPYEVVSRIGVGGMAETYVAVRRGPGEFVQRVCLKCIRPDLVADPEFVRQFMQEATLAARLRHTTIASVLDFGESGDEYFMALELIDGVDLRELLLAFPQGLAEGLVLQIAIELCTALDFAHRGGGVSSEGAIVHRDVSPSNTLISLEGEVKLTDFGIARSLGGPQHTRTGIVKGKVPYIAPEYARTGRFDERCDLYSLGVLLYESLCGERPHEAATDLDTLERASRGEHISLAARIPGSAALAEIVEQLLTPEPELRFQSAAAVIEALSALPPPPRARRELGALVTELRQKRTEREALQRASAPPMPAATNAAEPLASAPVAHVATPTQRLAAAQNVVADTSESIAIAGLTRSRGPKLALAVAAIFALGVIGLALNRPPRKSTVETALAATPNRSTNQDRARPAQPALQPAPTLLPMTASAVSQPESIVVRPLVPAPAPAPAPTSTKPKAQRSTLEVVVIPFGYVTVEGKELRDPPFIFTLKPGSHSAAARIGTRTVQQQVTLKPGEHRKIVMQ